METVFYCIMHTGKNAASKKKIQKNSKKFKKIIKKLKAGDSTWIKANTCMMGNI